MAATNAVSFAVGAVDPASQMKYFHHQGPQTNVSASESSIGRFEAALSAEVAQLVSREDQDVRDAAGVSESTLVLPETSWPETAETYGQMDTAALAAENERAVTGLELGERVPDVAVGNGTAGNAGDLVLNGLSKLRSVFDDQIGRVRDGSSAQINGTEKFFSMQVEMARFSLLMDLTSKLSGKATQTIDTLLKGQ